MQHKQLQAPCHLARATVQEQQLLQDSMQASTVIKKAHWMLTPF